MIDERVVTERFHEALDVEPRAGAYERFRAVFITPPAAAKRRPMFRLRFSRMTLRVAAAVAVVAIAIALVAGVLATHHPTAGVPAHTPQVDQNTASYRALMSRDYADMNASTSNHCNTIADTGCAAAIAPVNAALQKWIDDLASFHTPTAYVALDSLIRRHMKAVIDVQNAAIGYQKAGNSAAFTLAMNAAFYERPWIDPASFTAEGTYLRQVGSYTDAVKLAQHSIDACLSGSPGPADRACAQLVAGLDCTGSRAATCEASVEDALTQVETFLITVVQNPAPSNLSAKTATYETDLDRIDGDLLSITYALVAGDASKASDSQNKYSTDLQTTQGDVAFLLI